MKRLSREVPTTHGGIPVDIRELEMPETMMDIDHQYEVNNHHRMWQKQLFARFAISQTFRDLDIHQLVLPKDTHNTFHALYDPITTLPDPVAMLDIIDEQRAVNGLLRYGSASNPTYKRISPELWSVLMAEYNNAA